MSTQIRSIRQAAMEVSATPGKSDLLQRRCGGSLGPAESCHDSEKEGLQVQRSTSNQSQWSPLTPIGHEELTFKSRSSDGAPAFMKEGLGHDFGRVSVNSTPGPRVQTKLTISQPGDRFEREADRVAEQVMRSPEATDLKQETSIGPLPTISRWVGEGDSKEISRQPAEDEQEETPEEELDPAKLLSLKEASGSPHSPSPEAVTQIQSMRGSGQPLSPDLRSFFEPRFGHDFSQVRVHTDARAAQTTKALNARAFTLGSDVAFASSEYKPDTPAGRLLLAHELTHVVQQSNQVQTVMRACDCPAMGATKPSKAEHKGLSASFPQLKRPDYCVTGPETPKYNCFAWSVGDTSKWLDTEVDSVHGNKNGTLEYSDFDSMYAKRGLKPVIGSTPSNPEVALYGIGSDPTHAARRTGAACGKFESKLGQYLRIAHFPNQLEGGTVYGNINRYYVSAFKP